MSIPVQTDCSCSTHHRVEPLSHPDPGRFRRLSGPGKLCCRHRKSRRLTSNRPTEALVCWVCITSVRAHICCRLEETVLASGRSWDQTKTKMAHNQLLLSVQQKQASLSRVPGGQGVAPPRSGQTANQRAPCWYPGDNRKSRMLKLLLWRRLVVKAVIAALITKSMINKAGT